MTHPEQPKMTRRFSSEEIHRAVFAVRPKPRTLEELEKAVGCHAREKYARGKLDGAHRL